MDTQPQNVDSVRPGAIAAGAMLLLVGSAMLLDTTGVVDIRVGRLIAPLVLILIGTSMVLNRSAFVAGRREIADDGIRRYRGRRRGGATSGIWLIGIGVWMFLAQSQAFGLTFHNSWPLFIVLSGVTTVLRGLR